MVVPVSEAAGWLVESAVEGGTSGRRSSVGPPERRALSLGNKDKQQP